MAILNARDIDPRGALDCDVCIVGGGAAGITLALELAQGPTSVMLLESGHWRAEAATQSLYEGQVENESLHFPAAMYRERRFGGTTTIWSGRCVPYDEIDFEPRAYMPHSDWPFGRRELEPYYRRANRICEAGEFAYTVAQALPDAPRDMIPGFHSDRVLTDGLERFSRPTDFARCYRQRLEKAPRLRVVLGSNCVHIAAGRESHSVERLDIASLEGRRFSIRARHYVLAAGGLEVTRLLLASRDVYRDGIGNHSGLLGRFYMCHIAGRVGRLTFNEPVPSGFLGYERSDGGVYCRRRFQLAPEVQRELGVGNLIARVHHPAIADPSHRTGPLSALYLARRLVPAEFQHRVGGSREGAGVWARHLRNVLADPLNTARFASHWLWQRALAARKFPSVVVSPRTNRYTLEFHAEQAPNDASRVGLTDEQDLLGMPRLHIDWRYTPLDVDTVRRSLRVLAEELQRTGVARLEFDDAEVEPAIMHEKAYGGHHIGTTRMANSAGEGVVDANCRVHGLDNLFIASSSVFPTSSQANPTLTIVALALRLAAHLRAESER